MVGVGMAQRHHVQVTNTARPQSGRNNFFADIEILRGLLRTTAKSAAIHQQSFARGRNQQQGIALSHIDGLNEQRIVRMIDRSRRDGGKGRKKQGSPCCPASPAASASQHDCRRQQRTKSGRLPRQWCRNAKVAQRKRPENAYEPYSKMKKGSRLEI